MGDARSADAAPQPRVLGDKQHEVLFCDLPDIGNGAMARFMLTQMAAVAELEAGLIGERTKAAQNPIP